jgi:hypothetical protein
MLLFADTVSPGVLLGNMVILLGLIWLYLGVAAWLSHRRPHDR